MNKKFKLFIIVGCTLVFAIIASVLNFTKSPYNLNPDVSSKVIGSYDFRSTFFIIPYESIEDACRDADLVVIGTVVSDGETEYRSLYSDEPIMADKYEKTFPDSQEPVYAVSKSTINVEEVLYGSCNDTIVLTQNGEAGSDNGETKAKKNDRMLFILHSDSAGNNMWSSVSCEDGLYLIKKNGKIMSLTDNLHLAKYDDCSLSLLKKDINKAISTISASPQKPALPLQTEYDDENTSSDENSH